MNTDHIERLELFNEKTQKLLNSDYAAESRRGGIGAVVEWKREHGWDSVYVGPEGEALEALALTLRLFMQDNDDLSLRNMRIFYQGLPVDGKLAKMFADQCAELNRFLDSSTGLSIEQGRQLSHRDILNLFLYGSLAHVKPDKRKILKDVSASAFFPLFQASLHACIAVFLNTLADLTSVNDRALGELGRKS